MSVGKTSTALGAFYRRLAVRIGRAKAISATARKLALLVYRVLSGKLLYQDSGATLTINSIAPGNSSRCANVPNYWASISLITPPAKY